ncbi:hypothetical protein D3C75_1336440 [compost metagenome]
MKGQEDQRRPPPVAAQCPLQADCFAAMGGKLLQVFMQAGVEGLIADDQVGLKVQGQAQGVEVA